MEENRYPSYPTFPLVRWTVDNTHAGQYCIPFGINVFGNPEQAKSLAVRICSVGTSPISWGVIPVIGQAHVFTCDSFLELVDNLNTQDMRIMTLEEVRFLLLYASSTDFGMPQTFNN